MKQNNLDNATSSLFNLPNLMIGAAILSAGSIVMGLPLIYMKPATATTIATEAFPVGPADKEVAARYGTIDHSSLNNPNILPAVSTEPLASP